MVIKYYILNRYFRFFCKNYRHITLYKLYIYIIVYKAEKFVCFIEDAHMAIIWPVGFPKKKFLLKLFFIINFYLYILIFIFYKLYWEKLRKRAKIFNNF